MKSLTGKTAVVTGAGRGIGRAIAQRLGRDGANVIVNYAQNGDAAAEVVRTIAASGGAAFSVQADLSQIAEVRRLFDAAESHFGGLDILVNNAGTAKFGPLADVTEDEFDVLFAVNVKGVFFAMQEAARRMGDGGRIVNISSGITQFGGAGGALYAGTKGVVEQFALSAARELGPRGITVNVVSPGGTATDLLDAVAPPEVQEQMAAASPFGRLGQPADIADVVAFVVSDDARWLTGQNLRATGGAL